MNNFESDENGKAIKIRELKVKILKYNQEQCENNLPNFSNGAKWFFQRRHEVIVDDVQDVERNDVFELKNIQ